MTQDIEMKYKCRYPSCDCDNTFGECAADLANMQDLATDDAPAGPTVRERVKSVMAPGLGLVALLWRKITGRGRS